MTGEVTAILALAVTLAVAAIGALFGIMRFQTEESGKQHTYRHNLRSEIGSLIIQSEERLTRRIEQLERTSIGFRRAEDPRRGDNDG